MKALAGAVIGAGLVSASTSIGWLIAEYSRPKHALLLTYTKGGGTTMSAATMVVDDPTPITTPATRYIAFIASRCRLARWSMWNNEGVHDVAEQAVLTVSEDEVSDKQFQCLTAFVKPGYVTLKRATPIARNMNSTADSSAAHEMAL